MPQCDKPTQPVGKARPATGDAGVAGAPPDAPTGPARAGDGPAGVAAEASGRAGARRPAAEGDGSDGTFAQLVALALAAGDQAGSDVAPPQPLDLSTEQPEGEAAAIDAGNPGVAAHLAAPVLLAAAGGNQMGYAQWPAPTADEPPAPAAEAEGVASGPSPAVDALDVAAGGGPEVMASEAATFDVAVVAAQAAPGAEAPPARSAARADGSANPGQPVAVAATPVASGADQPEHTPAETAIGAPSPTDRPVARSQAVEAQGGAMPQPPGADEAPVVREAGSAPVAPRPAADPAGSAAAGKDVAPGRTFRSAVEAAVEVADASPQVSAPAEHDAAMSPGEVRSSEATSDPAPPDESITGQIAAQVRAEAGRGSRRVVVQLDPPELGRVRVTIREIGGDVRGELKFSDPQALSQARLETPGLVRQLAAGGVRVRQLDMSLEADDLQQQSEWLGREGRGDSRQGWGEWLGDAADQDVAGGESAGGDRPGEVLGINQADGGAVNLWV